MIGTAFITGPRSQNRPSRAGRAHPLIKANSVRLLKRRERELSEFRKFWKRLRAGGVDVRHYNAPTG